LNLVGSKNCYFIIQTRKLTQAPANYTLMLINHTHTAVWPVDSCNNYSHPVTRKVSNEVQILIVVYEIGLGSS